MDIPKTRVASFATTRRRRGLNRIVSFRIRILSCLDVRFTLDIRIDVLLQLLKSDGEDNLVCRRYGLVNINGAETIRARGRESGFRFGRRHNEIGELKGGIRETEPELITRSDSVLFFVSITDVSESCANTHLIKLTVVDVNTLIEILLWYYAVRSVQDLAAFPIVFQTLAHCVRQFTTGTDVTEENISLKTKTLDHGA